MFKQEGGINQLAIMEGVRLEMSKRAAVAFDSPIEVGKLEQLERELYQYREDFIKTGKRSQEILKREDEIKEEILHSSAVANTLTEFSTLLDLVDEKFGLSAHLKERFIPHENAHMNVAEIEGYQKNVYAIIFIKEGGKVTAQPVVLNEPDLTWTPVEMVVKDEKVVTAPEAYGDDEMSPGDKASLEAIRDEKEKLDVDNWSI